MNVCCSLRLASKPTDQSLFAAAFTLIKTERRNPLVNPHRAQKRTGA